MRRRLFFGLFPHAALRDRLAELACILPEDDGRRVKPENLHMTLLFLGGVDDEMLPALEALAGEIAINEFAFTLTKCGRWRKAGIIWLAPGSIPADLEALVEALGDAAAALGLPREERRFRPHVTLWRKAGGNTRLPDFKPLRWEARDFRLIESILGQEGPEYRELGRWSLGGR